MGATQSVDLSSGEKFPADGQKAKRALSESYGGATSAKNRARLRALASRSLVQHTRTTVASASVDGAPTDDSTVGASNGSGTRRAGSRSRNWPFGKVRNGSKSYSLKCQDCRDNGIAFNGILRYRQSQKRGRRGAKSTAESNQNVEKTPENKESPVESQLKQSDEAAQSASEAHEDESKSQLSNDIVKSSSSESLPQENTVTPNDSISIQALRKASKYSWADSPLFQDTVNSTSAPSDVNGEVNSTGSTESTEEETQKIAEDQLIDGELTVKLLRKIPQCAPPKPPRSPLTAPRKRVPIDRKASASEGLESPLSVRSICTTPLPPRKPSRSQLAPVPMDCDQMKVGLEMENNNIPARAIQSHSESLKSVEFATEREPDSRLVRQTASLPSASLTSLAPKRPTDLSISPREQRILRIPTSPTIERASDAKVKPKPSAEGAALTSPDDVTNTDDSPAIRRETSMPSIMAAAVVGSWRKGNQSPLTLPDQFGNFRDGLQKIKRLSLTSKKCTSAKADAAAEAALPSPTRLLGDIRGESASDDSLARGDDLGIGLKDYHLSNLSHEVLMQIIRRFPFANPPKKSLSRTSSNETSSMYDGAPETPSPSGTKKQTKTPITPSTEDSSNASPWNLKKRFLNRHYPTTVEAQRPSAGASENANDDGSIKRKSSSSLRLKMPRSKAKQLMRSESNANANDFKASAKSALGKLCKVSVDTMAITALPLDCWLKERLKNWVQLSGHAGTIVPASNHTLWKKLPNQNTAEAVAYAKITADPALAGLAPKFYKEITHKNESFIEIQDLLAQFPNTSSRAIMDIKMGVRTFLESEVSNTTKRTDLYKKMIDIDPDEPTEQERADEAITKLRYMQFRERESSTASLGFRIEAAQLPGGKLQKSFKKVHNKGQVMETLVHFFGERYVDICVQLAARLRAMRDGIQKSHFFRTHEVVGSSILVVFDDTKTGAWMIDFAKSTTVPESITVNHRVPWTMGNHEDGYLIGLGNLIDILETAEKESRRANVLTTVNK